MSTRAEPTVSVAPRHVLAGAALALVIVGVLLWLLDWREVLAAMLRANPWLLAAAALLTLPCYALRSWRWGELLAPLARVRQIDLFSATMVGFAASLVVPRSGELIRPWLIAKRRGVRVSAAFATIIVERLADLLCVIALFALYLFVLPQPAAQTDGAWISLLESCCVIALVAAAALTALLVALHRNSETTLRRLSGLLGQLPARASAAMTRLLRGFAAGLAVLFAPGQHLLRIGGQSLALWVLTGVTYHAVQAAFGIELPFHTTFLLIVFLVVGEMIPTPGLIGGFHAFYLVALAEVYGIDPELAAAAAIAAHALTNLPVLLMGAALMRRESFSFRDAAQAARQRA